MNTKKSAGSIGPKKKQCSSNRHKNADQSKLNIQEYAYANKNGGFQNNRKLFNANIKEVKKILHKNGETDILKQLLKSRKK